MAVLFGLKQIGRFVTRFRRRFGSRVALAEAEPPCAPSCLVWSNWETTGKRWPPATNSISTPVRSGCCTGWRKTNGSSAIPANIVAEAVRGGHRVAPAAEWLLDNYYLIAEQIDLARIHLPQTLQPHIAQAAQRAAAGLPPHLRPGPGTGLAHRRAHGCR